MRSAAILLTLATAAVNGFAASIAPVGPMVAARQNATATLLPDGTVLIAGGDLILTGPSPTSSAEIYDPARRAFHATGSLSTIRQQHAAVALSDGRVLIAGGFAFTGFQAMAATSEIYTPAIGAFANVRAISGERAQATATLLADGRVLLAGGKRSNNPLLSAEIYNPASGAWIGTGLMTQARSGHVAVRLADSSVLVAGGGNAMPAEIFNPATGVFTSLGNSPWAYSAAVLLQNGKVLLVGLGQIQTFDPATRTFSVSSARLETYRGEAVVALQDGSVLIAGGSFSTNPITQSAKVLLYLPGNDKLTFVGNLSAGRDLPTGTLLRDGTVLIAGGSSSSGNSAAAEIIDLRPSRSHSVHH